MRLIIHLACNGRMIEELCRHYTPGSDHADVTAIECTKCGVRTEHACKTCEAIAMHPAGKAQQ
jgi:hypothetical protein